MLPLINGKEIIPVRLIPLIVNAWIGQVTLAGILANKVQVSGWPYPSDHQPVEVSVYDEKTGSSELTTVTRADLIGRKKHVNGVHAFHLNDDGIPVIMRPSEWEAIYRDVSVLEPVLRKTEETNGVSDSMEAAWRLEATKVLPPGVFLYRDDYELLFQRHIDSFTSITDYDPPDFRMINYSVYIRPEYKTLVWEGLGHLRQVRTMSMPDQLLYTIDGLADRWKGKFTKDRIEDYLYNGQLKYSVRLTGQFLKYRNENGEKIPCGKVTRSKSFIDPRYDEFIIDNYYCVAPDSQNNFIDLGNAELLRFENDGCWYIYNMIMDIPRIGKEVLLISKEEIERFERTTTAVSEIGYVHDEPVVQIEDTTNAGKNLKKQQTAVIDAKIKELCSTIKDKAVAHMSSGGTERVVNHTRFIDEAELSQGKGRDRAFKLVKEYISSYEGDLRFHGFKYANKPIKSGMPYFLTDKVGLKPEE